MHHFPRIVLPGLLRPALTRLWVAAAQLAELVGHEAAVRELRVLARRLPKPPGKARGRPKKGHDPKSLDRIVTLAVMLNTLESAAREGSLPAGVNPRGWKLALAQALHRSGMAHSVEAARKELQRVDALRRDAAALPPSRLRDLIEMGDPDRKPGHY